MGKYFKWATIGLFVVACNNQTVPVFEVEGIEVRELISQSDLIIEGEVAAVDYRLANNNGTEVKNDEDGTVDSGRLAHTFVTYKIKEIFKGEYQEREITLRFLGGLDENNDFLIAGRIPLFDIGEKDVLFVKDNTLVGCPLYHCQSGRFRIAKSEDDTDNMMYTEDGHQSLLYQGGGNSALVSGQFKKISDVMTHVFVDNNGQEQVLEMVDSEHSDSLDLDPEAVEPKHSIDGEDDINRESFTGIMGTHLSVAHFRAFIRQAVEQYGNSTRPVISADLNAPFSIGSIADQSAGAMDEDPRVIREVESEADSLERELVSGQDSADMILTPEQVARIQAIREKEEAAGRQ